MNKLLVLTLLVYLEMYEISGKIPDKSEPSHDSQILSMALGTFDNSNEKIPDLGGIHINGTHQIFYINSPEGWKSSSKWSDADRKIGPGNTGRNGIDAHKVHPPKVSWNMARQICVEEGGHLAVIRTKQEMLAIKTLMVENSVDMAWVGFHDLFQEGDWISVLDEPIGRMNWDVWTKEPYNPNNLHGNENCATLVPFWGGLNDDGCAKLFPFVCKMNI